MSWTNKESKVQSINVNDIAKRSILEWFTQAYDKRGNFENEELGRIYQIPVNPETGEYTDKDTKDRRFYMDKVSSDWGPSDTEIHAMATTMPDEITDQLLHFPQDSITTSEYNTLVDSLLRSEDTKYVMEREPYKGDFRYDEEGWNLLDKIQSKAKGLFGRRK